MLDKHLVPLTQPSLHATAQRLDKLGASANSVTVAGFVLGLVSCVCVWQGQFLIALVFLILNRVADGIDGELARINQPTDAGAFLDILLDFIFYALFPLSFALYAPPENALPAAVLIASFVATGSSFLAFSSFANQRAIEHPAFGYKGFYYINGLAEGTETILFFITMCLWPAWFATLAWIFAAICLVTAVNRIVFGYRTLRVE